jgi:hypothetical protein
MPARDEPSHDVSRRDALKKLGVGAGIAWSAPVVMTFYNAAGAAAGTPSPTTSAETTTVPPPTDCDSGGTCNDGFPECLGGCICVTDAAGGSRCVPGPFSCFALDTCGPGNSCPPGFFCALGTCCLEPVCVPLSAMAGCPPDDTLAPQGAAASGPTLGSR